MFRNERLLCALVIMLILSLLELSLFSIRAIAESKNYPHLEGAIKDYYATEGAKVEIEPHGSRAADILGPDNKGAKIVGEIKKAAEIERDLGGYWSQWNSDRKFGGKSSDYKLAEQYADKGAALSRNGRGWAAVIDGQLRGYCTKELFGRGDLMVENFSRYEKDILETLNYLKKQGRISNFEVKRIPNSNVGCIRITFAKLPASVIVPEQKEPRSNKSTAKANTEKQIGSKTERSKSLVKVVKTPSVYSRIWSKLAKASIIISIVTVGYTLTAEAYHQRMAGKRVHPSRILARVVTGIVAGSLLGLLFGSLLSLIPVVGVVAGIIGAAIGSVLGAIGAEWLFELIMPHTGLGYAILDLLIGGILGSTVGTVLGLIRGLHKTPPIEISGFWGTLWEILTFPLVLLESCLTGAICGLVLGGFAGSLLFFVIFIVM